MISVNNYHIFKRENKSYVVVSNEKTYYEIDEETYKFLDDIKTDNFNSAKNKIGIKKFIPIFKKLSWLNLITKEELDLSVNDEDTFLTNIQLHVTHSCNLNCSYCYAGGGNYGGKEDYMSFETAKKAIDHLLKNSGCMKVSVSFFGGEPLCNLDLIKKVVPYGREEAKKINKEIHFGMTTNGVLLTKENVDYLLENNIDFMISLDGTKEVHDKSRKDNNGNGTFDRIMENVDYIKNVKNYPISFRATHTDFDDDIREIYNLFNEVEVKSGFVAATNNNETDYFEKMTERNSEILKEELEFVRTNGYLRTSPFLKLLDVIVNKQKMTKTCGAGLHFASVCPKGDVYFCHRFANNKDFKISSVYDKVLKLKKLNNKNVFEKKDCSECWAKYICGGQCFHECYESYNDINKSSEKFCNYYRSLIEDSIHLINEYQNIKNNS